MTPEAAARRAIDQKLIHSGWVIQDMNRLNLSVSVGVAVREFPTSTGEVDYALFVEGKPVGIIEAKRSSEGERITTVEAQSARYANSIFKWILPGYNIRFAYEAMDQIVRFTDYQGIKYRSRVLFSFHRSKTLKGWLMQRDTVRNNGKMWNLCHKEVQWLKIITEHAHYVGNMDV